MSCAFSKASGSRLVDTSIPTVSSPSQVKKCPCAYIILVNVNDGRAGKDANSILASIHTFDPSLACDSTTFQPCSDKALSNLKVTVDSFRTYSINSGIAEGKAVAVGRYIEDVYYNGNPWYLNTLAAAEQVYDAIYVWKAQGSITVTSTSLAFFQDLVSGVTAGTYDSSSSTFESIIDAASTFADGFIEIVSTYAGDGGALAEQFSKTDGTPESAAHLTWSYSAFLSAAARRDGVVPESWSSQSSVSLPGTCLQTSAVGSYSSATATSFPSSLTPISGTGTATATTTKATTTKATTTKATTTTTSCAVATSVAVTFNVRATTVYGQTIKVAGNIAALGNWDTSKAVALSASSYTSSDPLWKATINLPAGTSVQYKYINVASDGSVTWESGSNRVYTVASSCTSTGTASDTWRS